MLFKAFIRNKTLLKLLAFHICNNSSFHCTSIKKNVAAYFKIMQRMSKTETLSKLSILLFLASPTQKTKSQYIISNPKIKKLLCSHC